MPLLPPVVKVSPFTAVAHIAHFQIEVFSSSTRFLHCNTQCIAKSAARQARKRIKIFKNLITSKFYIQYPRDTKILHPIAK